MALSANPQIDEVVLTDEGSNTLVSDDTTYGLPELTRSEVGVFLLAYKVDEDLVHTALTIETYDPTVVTSWTIENTIDGYQKYVMLIVPSYTSSPTFNANDVVWDITTHSIYQNISGAVANSVPLEDTDTWAVKTAQEVYDLLDTASEPSNLVIGETSTVLTIKAKQCLGNLAPQHAKENCPGCPGNAKLKEQFDDLWLLIYLAAVASSRQKYVEGERFMRSAENYCDCGCN